MVSLQMSSARDESAVGLHLGGKGKCQSASIRPRGRVSESVRTLSKSPIRNDESSYADIQVTAGAAYPLSLCVVYGRREARQRCMRLDFMSLYPSRVSSSRPIRGPTAVRNMFA